MKSIIKELYKNSKLNSLEIIKLVFDGFNKNKGILSRVAINSLTPVFILEKLSEDEELTVRYWISQNTNTSISTLEKLSNDKECMVRYTVAQNPNTPLYLLEKLSKDKNKWVRFWVAHNETWIKYRKENGL